MCLFSFFYAEPEWLIIKAMQLVYIYKHLIVHNLYANNITLLKLQFRLQMTYSYLCER